MKLLKFALGMAVASVIGYFLVFSLGFPVRSHDIDVVRAPGVVSTLDTVFIWGLLSSTVLVSSLSYWGIVTIQNKATYNRIFYIILYVAILVFAVRLTVAQEVGAVYFLMYLVFLPVGATLLYYNKNRVLTFLSFGYAGISYAFFINYGIPSGTARDMILAVHAGVASGLVVTVLSKSDLLSRVWSWLQETFSKK